MSDTLLAIDAGNTRIKWGVHDGRSWSAFGAIDTAGAAGLYESLRAAPKADRAIASNVAGPGVRAAIESACAQASVPVAFARAEKECLGVTNGYADPAQLGVDRWVALVAAHRARRGHKVVVNVGTALTVDALTAEGRFLGGLIVPGPALMRRSLDHATAALREAQGQVRDFPASTPDAITTGAALACAGAIERLAATMDARACPPGLIILSGGGAAELSALLARPFELHHNLVLDGLQLIARSA